jgi:hypothetical protein
MDLLQEQVDILNIKVEALQQTVEQLIHQTAEILTAVNRIGGERSNPPIATHGGRYSHSSRSIMDGAMEHKDILVDTPYLETDSQTSDRNLTPEIQIQRLTAQLTAAYNRIAALEEQLLAKRLS